MCSVAKGGSIHFKSVIWESHLALRQLSFPKYKLVKLAENSFESPLLLRHKVLTDVLMPKG